MEVYSVLAIPDCNTLGLVIPRVAVSSMMSLTSLVSNLVTTNLADIVIFSQAT
jgi:hypothetical protein